MPHSIPRLATDRLLLLPIELADASAVQASFPRWEIVRFLGSHVPWPYPADGALAHIRDVILPAMRQGLEWHWSIRRKERPGELLGIISLMKQADNNRGFWLDPAYWGQGLAREASDAVTDYWFDTLGMDVMRIPKATDNPASRALSENSGMRVIWRGEKDYVSGRLPSELWEITAEEWRAFRRRTNTDSDL